MHIAFFTLIAALSLTACASFDPYVDRQSQCVLLDAAKVTASAKGLDVDTYLNTSNVFICPEVTE